MEENVVEINSAKEFSFFHIIDESDFLGCFHCHDFYEVYISVSGGKNFIINNKIYDMMPRDLFINNNYEIHKTTTLKGIPYERYVLEFKPEFVLPYCTNNTNLLHYFRVRPENFSHKISLSVEQFEHLLMLFNKYENLNRDVYGKDVLEKIYFIEMLVYISKIFNNEHKEYNRTEYITVITPMLNYISENLSGDLCLDRLASQVNISKDHMCKLFKKCTGTTINKFIVKQRIARAKELLNQKLSPTEVCAEVGFNDYCHFIRTFREVVGVSPVKYSKGMRID
ncbi:MAG: AraC family transcriptional regulator [Clostridiales bacterium]|nr:AraC family transcriptional regulator [Clostridiales bacterium]